MTKLSRKLSNVEVSKSQLKDFARLYSKALMNYFTRHGCQKATADDLVQEVFIRLAGRVSGGEIEKPEAYLMRTASNVWRDFMRKRRTHAHSKHSEYDEENHSLSDFSPEDSYEVQETIHRLLEVLKDMPPRTRQVFLLCRYEGMKQEAVAKRLGVTPGCVSKQMAKAITYLALCFGDQK